MLVSCVDVHEGVASADRHGDIPVRWALTRGAAAVTNFGFGTPNNKLYAFGLPS